ncbi:MAG TPA: hypothetical protein VGS00_09465 [Thermoanaerobaculia bacterium]|nr:hypothetical protein [Thermoanaerobaculia bacterium]
MKRWEVWVNHAGWSLVALSGVAYGVLKHFVTSPDPDSRLSHPWQPALLAVHVLAAPVAVFGLGLLFRSHALARIAAGEREGRRTGVSMTRLAVPLALSGYLLQALTGDAARRWTGWLHAGAGLLFAAAYAAHPRRSRLPDDAAEASAEAEDRVP